MVFFAVIGAFFLLGHELSAALWRRAQLSLFERITSIGVLGFAVWTGVSWSLAIPFRLTEGALIGAAIGALATAVALRLILARGRPRPQRPDASSGRRFELVAGRGRPATAGEAPARQILIATLTLLPLAGWTAYLLWRGYVAPPLAPDALTYHMPRALMFARYHGYTHFPIPDSRVNGLPATYELLVSTFLLLQHSDTYTEWLSTLAWLLFLAASAALIRRWWGSGIHVPIATLIAACAPVLLLQGAAHKNDLPAGFFFLSALLFLGRWLTDGEFPAAVVAVVAIALAIGLKPHGAILGVVAVPLLLWGSFRRGRRPRAWQIAVMLMLAAAAVPLFGGWHYVHRFLHPPAGAHGAQVAAPVQYGAWRHLWEVPVLMWLAPFSKWDDDVWVPWDDSYWMWERYDQFASHFGWILSVLALVIPWTLWLDRHRPPDPDALLERRATTIAGLVVFAAILPTRFIPEGYVSAFPRYALYLIPMIAGWSIPPLMRYLARIPAIALAVAAALFAFNAVRVAQHDKWGSFSLIRWAAEHPGERWMPSLTVRAAFHVDAVAGPEDVVDVHGGDDTWIYPAYGARLRRDVRFIDDAAQIRPNARWVMVDRAFSGVWRDPRFQHIRQWHRMLGRGHPQPEDTIVIRELRNDPRFELVYYNEKMAQAVFRRRGTPHPPFGHLLPSPRGEGHMGLLLRQP